MHGSPADDVGAAADAVPTWLDFQLQGHVLVAFGAPESLLVWETPATRSNGAGSAGDPEVTAPPTSSVVKAHSALVARTNARVMGFVIHQLRNALHALDASTQLIVDSTSQAPAAGSQGPGAASTQQDLADLVQVRSLGAQAWPAPL